MELRYEVEGQGVGSTAADVERWVTAGLMMDFAQVAILAHDADNVAIAKRDLPRGTKIKGYCDSGETEIKLNSRILEGHRFCVRTISSGQALLSWAMPFGIALSNISPGQYVCNEKARNALLERGLGELDSFVLDVNFQDIRYEPYEIVKGLDESENPVRCEDNDGNIDPVKVAENITFQGF